MSDLQNVTVGVFHAGSRHSLVVLEDWKRFLGSDTLPLKLMTLSNHEGNFSADDVREIWVNSDVCFIDHESLSLQAIEPAAMFELVSGIDTEWVLVIKLDVLPDCARPDEGFLSGLIKRVEQSNAWGCTGAFIPPDLTSDKHGEWITARYSNNYSLFRPKDWLNALQKQRPDHVQAVRERLLVPESRFVTESAIEQYLAESGERMLFLEDTPDRYVFHVNQWEDELLKIRNDFKAKRGIEPFMNRYRDDQREPWTYPAWQRYYGWPKLGVLTRVRMKLGALRRRVFG